MSKEMARLGFSVCPPIELSDSAAYNIQDKNLVHWIMYMFECRRFRSGMAEPPCTSFSPAAHPACRSYKEPSGFIRTDARTLRENATAFPCLAICFTADRHQRPFLLEQPFLSNMVWPSVWRFLVNVFGWQEAKIASCSFWIPTLENVQTTHQVPRL